MEWPRGQTRTISRALQISFGGTTLCAAGVSQDALPRGLTDQSPHYRPEPPPPCRAVPGERRCSCLTLIVACIIYWQAKEIARVIRQADLERNRIKLGLLRHISPIEWENVVVYGEYRLDRRRIRRSQ